MSERRKPGKPKSSPLPVDYLKMVSDVFATNFAEGLEAVQKLRPKSAFVGGGAIYPDEICFTISLIHPGQLAATTVRASVDYDPLASSPKLDELLSICVDASGSIFGDLLDASKPAKIEALTASALSELENVPFQWTEVKIDKRRVWLLVDKSNPQIDDLADDWLSKHDPEREAREAIEAAETEKLFITGESARKKREDGH